MDILGGFFDEAVGATAPAREIWAAGIGARVGFLVTPQILTFVDGGWTPTRFGNVNFPRGRISLPEQTFNGGFIDGGTEVAVPAVWGLYWRNEYRLSSYRAKDLQFSVNGMPIVFFDHQSATVQTITTALVWKFH
jgi:outer membrane immunogenic protein